MHVSRGSLQTAVRGRGLALAFAVGWPLRPASASRAFLAAGFLGFGFAAFAAGSATSGVSGCSAASASSPPQAPRPSRPAQRSRQARLASAGSAGSTVSTGVSLTGSGPSSTMPAREPRRRQLPAPWPQRRMQQSSCCCDACCGGGRLIGTPPGRGLDPAGFLLGRLGAARRPASRSGCSLGRRAALLAVLLLPLPVLPPAHDRS